MILKSPCIITPRLLPGVKIGGAYVSIEYAGINGTAGRTRYRWYIDVDGAEYTGDDLQSGHGGGDLRQGLESLLSFLSACGESVSYAARTGRSGENADLFPPAVAEWCAANDGELSMAAMEVQETADCIVE